MKKYILSLMALLLTATALVSCDDDFDDIKVSYPGGFPTLGVWSSEYTNNDDSEYSVILNMKDGKPTLTVLMYGKSDDEEAAGKFYVAFQSDEFELGEAYDPEVGQLVVTGNSLWGTARVSLSYLSDLSTMSMQLEVNTSGTTWSQYCITTLKPTDTLPLYGYQLDGTGAVDDATGVADTKYYRFVLNSPNRKSVGYCYIAASSKPSDIRKAEIVDFYYSMLDNTYNLWTPDNEQMVLTINENYEPVIKLRGKTLVLNFGSHVLAEKEFAL